MLNYKTHNDIDINCNGTSLQGEIDVSYKDLKKLFGNPLDGDGYKVDAEWKIEFEDGEIATIYNYKSGKNYLGSHGTAKTKIRDWHIGGHTTIVVERIKTILSVPFMREKKLKRITK